MNMRYAAAEFVAPRKVLPNNVSSHHIHAADTETLSAFSRQFFNFA
jgi:hypothetical protein